MTKVLISGCNGHMGKVVADICAEDPDIEVVGGFDLRFNYHLTGEIDQINRVAYFSLKTVRQQERRRQHGREGV